MSGLSTLELPAGWAMAPLGAVADTALGKMLDKAKSTAQHTVPYLRNVNVQWGRIDLDDVLSMDIPPEQQNFFALQAGDLLVCEGGEFGRCAVWQGTSGYMAFQKALHRIRPTSALTVRYLRYFLEYLATTGGLTKFSTGSTIKHLPQQRLREVPIALPPIAEQHRIVEALEDHLSRLDAAMHLLDRVDRATSTLDLAHKLAISSPPDYAEAGWDVVAFGDLIMDSRGGWSRSRQHLVPSTQGTPYLKMNNITMSGKLDLSNVVHVTTTDEDLGKYQLKHGDILFNNKNSAELVGKTAMVDSQVTGWVFNENISRIRLIDSVLPEFAILQMSSPRFRKEIRGMRSASTNVSAIYTRDLKRASFFLPPVDVQKKLVAEYEDVTYALDRTRPTVRYARDRGASLRLALFHRAFSGRLVPQDPADEAAGVLLERAEAEREAQGGNGKRVARLPRKTAGAAVAPSPPPPARKAIAPATAVQQELPL
ncbi:restriction endonuclease subunit S [Streptomyces sp. NBC_00320]|uniref:restriction endonuclease subunit S n=1 Tax=Streptomyces sp. NBC_00320 TaxID=2975711 RepID=UPI00224EFA69|nr:restriction endonuclease subunit S [Streptomyces sp. NBC_00320]MCX5145388.1 restriction endonuclease subunit S [Streptomyces sp. NBC_00320]